MMIREVGEEVNSLAVVVGEQPIYFDPTWFNILQNKVCAVFTLNADESFPENE